MTVTILDGYVLARSAFESSMNYRSVMALGRCEELHGDEKMMALNIISHKLLPRRADEIRPAAEQEAKATSVLALPLTETSVKVRSGGPEDIPADLTDPTYGQVWGGHVPVYRVFGEPVPDEHTPDRDSMPDYGW